MTYLHSFAKERDLLSIPARLGLMAVLLAGLALGPVPPQTAQAQGVIRVTTTGATSTTCGDTWANGCDLQYALTTVAASGDEVWVAQGTYRPTSGTDRAATFQLKNGVALYGGFAGTETSRDQRDWENRITTLSGDLNGDDDGLTNNGENSYHVVTGGGTDGSAVLDGFTVTGGNANRTIPYYSYDGGGMYNEQSSPTLTNVTFSGNSADRHGGGMYNDQSSPTLNNVTFNGNSAYSGGGMCNDESSPTLTNVTFSGNSADYAGGGMDNYDSNPTLTNVTFSGNSAANYRGGGMFNHDSSPTLSNVTFSGNSTVHGGGMYNLGSSPTLSNVTFSGNSASISGGGMHNAQSSSPTMTNVTFSGNSAVGGGGMCNYDSSPTLSNVTFSGNSANYGGGMDNDQSSPTLTNVTFSGNSADYGGGMHNYNWQSSNPTLTNVTFSGNSAANYGGGMYNNYSSPTLTNVTLSGNSADDSGGGMYNNTWYSSPKLRNCILWGNTAPSGPQIFNDSSSPYVTYSLVQGGYAAGTDVIDADPLFVRNPDPGDGDWGTPGDNDYGDLRLQAGSPAIDAGNNTAVPAGVSVDLAGNPRFINHPQQDFASGTTPIGTPPIVDLGAYEAGYVIYLPIVLMNSVP